MTEKFFQGTHKINRTYSRYSLVVDGNTANKIIYIAIKDVPTGTSLKNTEYWIMFDVEKGALTPDEILAMIKEITGDLNDLTTEDKNNLVSAINELDAEHEALSETVSDIDTLLGHEPLTTEATTVTGAINELVTGVDGLGDRVDALEERPEPVQSDWNETDTTDLAFIKNKPTIPNPYELPIATTSTLGGIKPDGTTITVDANGVASASGGGSGGEWTLLGNKPSYEGIILPDNYNDIICLVKENEGSQISFVFNANKNVIDTLFAQTVSPELYQYLVSGSNTYLTKIGVGKTTQNKPYINCGVFKNSNSVSSRFTIWVR